MTCGCRISANSSYIQGSVPAWSRAVTSEADCHDCVKLSLRVWVLDWVFAVVCVCVVLLSHSWLAVTLKPLLMRLTEAPSLAPTDVAVVALDDELPPSENCTDVLLLCVRLNDELLS